MREPETEAALRADMRAARSPSPASRAQDYKLGGPAEERRYTCPSYELERTAPPPADWPTANRVDLPGFRPVEAYEAAIANLAPELARRPDPEDVVDVLAWAGMPLATAEVAMVCNREPADVRERLAKVASFTPVGGDGYWSLAGELAERVELEQARDVGRRLRPREVEALRERAAEAEQRVDLLAGLDALGDRREPETSARAAAPRRRSRGPRRRWSRRPRTTCRS